MGENISYLQLITETILTFFVLLILTRLLGEKQIGHLTFFNYITGITIGSLAANMIMLSSKEYLKELTSLVIWCLLTTLIGYISLKSGKMRVVLDGQPTIVMKKGIIDVDALARTKLSIDDLTMMIRQKDCFSIAEIDYAILEPNGTLSILKKAEYQNIQKSDMQIKTVATNYIPAEIIVDGKIIKRNLIELGLSQEWLDKELEKLGIHSINNIIYAEVQSDGKLIVQKG